MKQYGKCITGDPLIVDSYTSQWETVRLHPTIFYRRIDEFQKGFQNINGLYAEIDMGQYVIIRFSDKVDKSEFHKLHYAYV